MIKRVWNVIATRKPRKPVKEPTTLRNALIAISKRAERLSANQLADTYVSLSNLDALLRNPDHRVIYGRRGTGKTHLLSHLRSRAESEGDIGLYLDLRRVGSNSYMYQAESGSDSERITRLLRDFLNALADALLDTVTSPSYSGSLGNISQDIDALGGAIQSVLATERVTVAEGNRTVTSERAMSDVRGKFSAKGVGLEGGVSGGAGTEREGGSSTSIEGVSRLSINIGNVNRLIDSLSRRLNGRIYLLIDEWGEVPIDLQPYLADFLKRVIFPQPQWTVVIAAIEQRSDFRTTHEQGDIGFELGSDIFADIHLDDYLVYENDPATSQRFFCDLLTKHINSIRSSENVEPLADDDLIRRAFTQEPAFKELVRASEGVPRDAINIAQAAASKSTQGDITIHQVRAAARDWYDRDKRSYIDTNPEADSLLTWIVEQVIGERKSRAFLLETDAHNITIEKLFDERLLHIAKRTYSAQDIPGVRYRVWKIDYGCYVDRINTAGAPTGFVEEGVDIGSADYKNVPEDDFRAIRRTILDLEQFYKGG